MQDELSIRQSAIRLRLAGQSIESICRTLKRSRVWFPKWWRRHLESGPEGLYDLTRGNHQVVNRTPPHVERVVISIRRRLVVRATPQTRYNQIGAAQIRAELETLGYSPLPSLRTVRRIITRAGLSCPPLRLFAAHHTQRTPRASGARLQPCAPDQRCRAALSEGRFDPLLFPGLQGCL
jgi:putative transposase